MTTPTHDSDAEKDPIDHLKPAQITALQALLAGETVTAAAEAAGVSRSAVSDWKNNDPYFIAAYRAAKSDTLARCRQQLVAQVVEPAREVVAQAVQDGDVTTARRVLKGLGVLDTEPIESGITDPEVVRVEQAFQGHVLDELRAWLGIFESPDGAADRAAEKLGPALAEEEGTDPETKRLAELRERLKADPQAQQADPEEEAED